VITCTYSIEGGRKKKKKKERKKEETEEKLQFPLLKLAKH